MSADGSWTGYRVVETQDAPREGDVLIEIGGGVGKRFLARKQDLGGALFDDGRGDSGAFLLRVFLNGAKDPVGWKQGLKEWLTEGGHAVITARSGEGLVACAGGRVMIGCAVDSVEKMIRCAAVFAAAEGMLRSLEVEAEQLFPDLEKDSGWAYRVDRLDRSADAELKQRAHATMLRRLTFMRWEPVWAGMGRCWSDLGDERLGESLREEACFEDRCELLDGRIEAAEYVYELVGQRAGEFRHAREGYWIEWIIVVLLAAELGLMLLEYLE